MHRSDSARAALYILQELSGPFQMAIDNYALGHTVRRMFQAARKTKMPTALHTQWRNKALGSCHDRIGARY